ncbi:hypothetical protein, partial [Photobacterium damselae]|uniref:hypothetical protein n=1 Tax=Photobacterium damselae TaxID=38293 RepID=UPI0014856B3D
LFLKLTTVLGKKAAYLSIFLALFFSLIQIIDATVVVLLNNLSANFNHSSWQSLNVFVPYGLTRCFSVYFSWKATHWAILAQIKALKVKGEFLSR